jgi:serine/threonine protein phosphatase 1
VHGMDALLGDLLARIADEPGADRARIVLVGDMIDRGPDSAAVLRRMTALCLKERSNVICLMGNHERMMLDFLADPVLHGPRWLNVGGQETLHSFGVTGRVAGLDAGSRLTGLAAALRAAMPPYLLAWLGSLPLYWQGQGLVVSHAGADPAVRMAEQTEAALLWGHRNSATPRADGLWLAHGHVIVPDIRIENGRIRLDTGAYRTGRLSALWLDRHGARPIVAASAA